MHRSVSQFFQEWVKILVNCLYLRHKVAGYASGVARRTFSLLGHTPWNRALHIYPTYHPVSVLNTTSWVVFWHAPSEFFLFLF